MDIKSISTGLNARTTDNNQPQVTKATGQNDTAAKAATDKVTISSSVQDLEQQAKTSSVDNSARIERLRHAIEDGSYKIDAEKVATKLIETELILAGA